MKKILVTGASGVVGVMVLKYLLAEGKYEITALDLKTRKSQDRLKRFRKRINIVYGDVTDPVLIGALVKGHDYVIHLASSSVLFASINKNLSYTVDYLGTVNICEAIKKYNQDCHILFASTTSMYDNIENPSVKSKLNIREDDYYDYYKNLSEKVVEKMDKYTIYRLPLVLSNPLKESFIYNIKNNDIDVITKRDAANAFVLGIKNSDKINKRIFNLASEEIVNYQKIYNNVLKNTGLNVKLIASRIFLTKDYTSPVCKDRDELENLIGYRCDSVGEYNNRLRNVGSKRRISKIFAKPFIRK